jgi:hypothetical protein
MEQNNQSELNNLLEYNQLEEQKQEINNPEINNTEINNTEINNPEINNPDPDQLLSISINNYNNCEEVELSTILSTQNDNNCEEFVQNSKEFKLESEAFRVIYRQVDNIELPSTNDGYVRIINNQNYVHEYEYCSINKTIISGLLFLFIVACALIYAINK